MEIILKCISVYKIHVRKLLNFFLANSNLILQTSQTFKIIFVATLHLVDTMLPCLTMDRVKTTFVTPMLRQINPLSQHFKELVCCRRMTSISKQGFFSHLPILLVDEAELVVVDHHVLVVVDDQVRSTWTHDWLKLVNTQVGAKKPGHKMQK